MQFNRVNNKERLHSIGSQWCIHQDSMCAQTEKCWQPLHRLCLQWAFCVEARLQGRSTPLPSISFHCLTSVTVACPPFCMGAHGWETRICQPWDWSPSRSWLPIVEAPGCLRHPTSICDAFAVNNRKLRSLITNKLQPCINLTNNILKSFGHLYWMIMTKFSQRNPT